MVDRGSSRPKVAAHVTGSFVPQLDRAGGGGGEFQAPHIRPGVPGPSVSVWLWRSSAAPASAGRRVQGQKISWWEGQKGLAFLQDVELVDGELVVPWPGLYYVYAQTYFRHTHWPEDAEEGEEEEGDRGRPLLQYVYKKVRLRLV